MPDNLLYCGHTATGILNTPLYTDGYTLADNSLEHISTKDLYKAAAIAEGYESVPVDIDRFVNDPQYIGAIYGEGRVYPYWMERLRRLYPNPLYSPYIEVCLSGDTEVDLLDGTTKTMGQICEEYNGEDFWVLGFNVNTKEWEPCKAHSPAITGFRQVYKVTLDNGKWFKATAEHEVLGKDNRWYRTDRLKVGQSLMPYNLSYDDKGYAYVWDNASGQKMKRGRLVQNWKNPLGEGVSVHHKNQNKVDDRPCNLLPVSTENHFQRMRERNKDPERQRKAHLGKILKNLNREPNLDTMTVRDLDYARRKSIARNFDCLVDGKVDLALLEEKRPSIVEQAKNYNHRIVSIELLPAEPVFNFTVDVLHNYTLSCGVVVSNCITGCIGAGKSTVSIIGVLYDLYRVTLLKDPHKKFKLIPTTPIVITLITATMDLAGAVLADQLIDVIGASPYFRSKLLPGKGDRIDEEMFPHHVGIAYGSRMRHSLGKAVIGAIIDEANFQNAVADQAVQNYNSIRRRMFSRFMTKGGIVPCRMWVVSSRNESTSFLESHIDAERNNPQVAIFEPAIWEVQAHKGIYCGKTFPVFIGSDIEQPKIITSDKELDDYQGRIIQVPVEYRKDFENNLPGSLQDLAGVATRNGVNLIYNVEALDKAMCLENCMTTDELHLTLDGDDQIQDFYKGNLPKGRYYVHLDGGVRSDRFGFAMSRVTENISVTTTSSVDGGQVSKISPAVETPLVFGIKALPGSEVPFWKVRVFINYLRSQGVSIALITCDGYQSVDMMQLLTKMGFTVKYASVDKTKDPYLKLSSNILLGLIKMPRSKILRNELINLQNLPKKIDHPATVVIDGEQVAGGKDIADSVASSSFEAIGASISLGASSILQLQKTTPTKMTMRERQEYIMEKFFKMKMF